jgi:hypothetical protein
VTAPARRGGRGEPAVLARELADFLIEFSIALHKNAIYPPGHPLLGQAVEQLDARCKALFAQERETLSIGVARRQLIIEGVATDPNHPLLRELAIRLHKHHVGAVRFARGLEREELRAFLATLAVDPNRLDLPLGLGDPEALQQWPHARLYPMSFDQLQLIEDEADAEEGGRESEGERKRKDDGARVRAASLWIGLARAALANDGDPASDTDPTVVAKAINARGRDQAYEQVVVGYLLQIAEELKTAKGREAAALRKRISRLVEQLTPETLERLLEMGGDTTQRNAFVATAAQAMQVEAVLDIVQAAARSNKQGISHALVRMLNKFAAHATRNDASLRAPADAALREHVQRLIGEWTLDDPNPGAYGLALEGMAKADPLYPGVDRYPCEPDRMIAMALEVGAMGDAVWRAVDGLTEEGAVSRVLALAGHATDGTARDTLLDRLATPERLAALLRPGADTGALHFVHERLGLGAVAPLLDALESADERVAETVVELLLRAPDEAGAEIVRRLPTAPWGTLRTLLHVLGRLPSRPAGFEPALWAVHPDTAVRREAIRLMLRDAAQRDEAITLGLLDADVDVTRLALGAALQGCPAAAVTAAMERADDAALPTELRALAVSAAAASRAEAVLPWLVERATQKRRILGGVRLADKSPEVVAAVAGLAQHWASRPAAESVLDLARRHKDPEFRAAAQPRTRRTP